ncbi:Trk system potassium transporter TrkA [Haloarcula hispanica]|jgi:trk system potassium uptake protein TrkA|uniref:Trk system potassium transporter TrkA n=2 Tax=Haloarculaceae TaxID=1963268 RepID=A0A5J5LCI8_HALHI|nr:Trk system potassium transporter TrkA [Haloarcula sp. CBA1115]AJF27837.1 potassium transporter TrkA [Haloarcula sp. CBA1115]KAA9400996.1 Trk system potassium transporter TrkA [Haloarcula sp. CBA1131]KAA9404741.1 Trk system potassium transporter TrkA [Haloarcula hispanica]
MQVVIVGAGQVGLNIAASLSENHDVVVIDTSPEKVEQLTYSIDVLAIEGDGTSLETLQEASIAEADMLIASTDDDETNLVTCGTAKTVSDAFTIARVRNEIFFNTWELSEGAFGVDFMVSTNLLTADNIARIVGLPAAVDVETYSGGLVQMAEFELMEENELVGQTVAEADQFEALTFAAIARDEDIIIPDGDSLIEAGDRVIIIGEAASIRAFSRTVTPATVPDKSNDIVIVGGSDIGYHTARRLEGQDIEPRLIEQDAHRAQELAETLQHTLVLNNDATDTEFLRSENIGQVGTLITATDSDEKNLLVSLLAKDVGVQRTVAIVEDGEYAPLFEAVGVDVAVNPREVTAEEIIRFTQEGQIENLSLVENRQAEVIEIEVTEESVLADRPINESITDLPSEVVIGAVTRGREFIVPRGETIIKPGDHVVLFVSTHILSEVMNAI